MEATAPAKIILFGEHAVVYGQPAIAAPVTSLRARVQLEPGPQGTGMVIDSPMTKQTLAVTLPSPEDDETLNSLIFACQLVIQRLQISPLPDLRIHLVSDIPLGRGLGSGAAIAAALIRALCAYWGQPISNDDLNPLVYEVEKRHHGTPSGIDNTVIVYEKPVFFRRGQALETVHIAQPLTLLVGDTGYGTPTHIPVGDLRRLHERRPEWTSPLFERIGQIAQAARQSIESGAIHPLGALMNENHDLLQRLTVSSVELDVLCEAALAAGAHGAKMSGGGRGGNMIALVDDSIAPQVIQALQRAGAARVVKTRVRPASEL
jgi:mevalonate kinase